MKHHNLPGRHRRLWHEEGDKDDEIANARDHLAQPDGSDRKTLQGRGRGVLIPGIGSEESFLRARRTRGTDLISMSLPEPPCRPFLEIMSNSLVVGQEVSITVLLLAFHRGLITEEGEKDFATWSDRRFQWVGGDKWDSGLFTMGVVYIMLLFIRYYSERANSRKDDDKESNVESYDESHIGHVKATRRKRMVLRAADAILLAGILRLLSAVLRTLTASYSTDTVSALSACAMVVHVLACDYEYANGSGITVNSAQACLTGHRHFARPIFVGGTISLNAALFSTTLLASRLPTNTLSFVFVSWSVILFAFYPEARHALAAKTHKEPVSPCFFITLVLSIAALVLLSDIEKAAFAFLQVCVLVASPTVKWFLQRQKEIITGPWDIAHIVVDDGDTAAQLRIRTAIASL